MESQEANKEEFVSFSSIGRLRRYCVITEKIDGTNAQIFIDDAGNLRAGSRSQWITPDNDNFGFARWVDDHKSELLALGPGRHFGEWWGSGIQRRYGIEEKRFSLFNTRRWHTAGGLANVTPTGPLLDRVHVSTGAPPCCHVVPVVASGIFVDGLVEMAITRLLSSGSLASPGFMKPEGIVIYHHGSGSLMKYTFDGDGHKGAKNAKKE